jgi:hypothetical protein
MPVECLRFESVSPKIYSMKLLLAITAFLLALAATAQPYNKAIGIKFPVGTGVTYKKFISEKSAFEFQALHATEAFRVNGLYEFHFPFTKAEGLSWYVGPGVHVGFYKNDYQKNYNSKMDLGIDGVIGLDYKFGGIPINVAVDWQPSFSFTGNSGTHVTYGGVAVRYTF